MLTKKRHLTGWPLGIYKLEENLKLQTNFQISPKFGLPQVPQILQYSPDLISLLNVLKNMRITQNSNRHWPEWHCRAQDWQPRICGWLAVRWRLGSLSLDLSPLPTSPPVQWVGWFDWMSVEFVLQPSESEVWSSDWAKTSIQAGQTILHRCLCFRLTANQRGQERLMPGLNGPTSP